MRGEDVALTLAHMTYPGSPPHARGRPGEGAVGTPRRGITPACAGKTWRAGPPGAHPADHPRMRGEDYRSRTRCGSSRGSPPHARGRQVNELPAVFQERITPACAGKTTSGSSKQVSSGDHPRMRGEDKAVVADAKIGEGSPPHARGRR